MKQMDRAEIEKDAVKKSSAARARIATEYEEKKTKLLTQVRLTRDGSGYLPAITILAMQRVRETILAEANAYVAAFDECGVPSDSQSEQALQESARQYAGGCISWVRGGIPLVEKRTRDLIGSPGQQFERDVENAMRSAVTEGLLLLKNQRAQAGRSHEQNTTNSQRGTTAKSSAEQSSTAGRELPTPAAPAQIAGSTPSSKPSRKGDVTLLADNILVTFSTAQEYLGILPRQRQSLVKQGKLVAKGNGHNRKITTESLMKYLPPENPK